MVDTSSALIDVRDLHKTYRMGKVSLEVLHGLSLTVDRGEFVGIYGHSGSGKSTLLHLMGLLDKPTSGTVFLDGIDTNAISGRRRNQMRCRDIGFVFQFYHLLPELSVLENTVLPAMVDSGIWRWASQSKQRKSDARELLDELGLSERLKHKPAELSGGERQRVAIARALLHKPMILLADEPTGNLDSHTGQTIMQTLQRFHREHNQTIVMVTHDDELAHQIQRTIRLDDGEVVNS